VCCVLWQVAEVLVTGCQLAQSVCVQQSAQTGCHRSVYSSVHRQAVSWAQSVCAQQYTCTEHGTVIGVPVRQCDEVAVVRVTCDL
jgi:hypothetical protein